MRGQNYGSFTANNRRFRGLDDLGLAGARRPFRGDSLLQRARLLDGYYCLYRAGGRQRRQGTLGVPSGPWAGGRLGLLPIDHTWPWTPSARRSHSEPLKLSQMDGSAVWITALDGRRQSYVPGLSCNPVSPADGSAS